MNFTQIHQLLTSLVVVNKRHLYDTSWLYVVTGHITTRCGYLSRCGYSSTPRCGYSSVVDVTHSARATQQEVIVEGEGHLGHVVVVMTRDLLKPTLKPSLYLFTFTSSFYSELLKSFNQSVYV